MNRERGSISLGLLVVCVVLALGAQLALLWSGQEAKRTGETLLNKQLRVLCVSAFRSLPPTGLPAGEWELCRGSLRPSQGEVVVTGKSEYSDDGLINFLEVSAAVVNQTSAVQRLRRLRVEFAPCQQELAANYALASKVIEGSEYLASGELYIQATDEEVKLPAVEFFQNRSALSITPADVKTQGLSTQFTFLPSSSAFSFAATSSPMKGATVLGTQGSISIGKGCSFPERLVLVSRRGNIVISQNVSMAKALVIAYGNVTVEAGCKINGLIIANRIILKGASTFTKDADVVAPFVSTAYIN